jgi:hypothetical protein
VGGGEERWAQAVGRVLAAEVAARPWRRFPHPSLADAYVTVCVGKITKLPNQNWHLKQVRSTINKLLQPGSHELKVTLLYRVRQPGKRMYRHKYKLIFLKWLDLAFKAAQLKKLKWD